ncbi:MAG: 3-dehydroquinate synthase [Spirochaetaceae bacterium]|nr:MAG: 3-dehydroquinate synthase [Spirochaetaceae bacterium]
MTGQAPLSYRFGEYTSKVAFFPSIDTKRLSGDSGTLLVFDKNTAGIPDSSQPALKVVLPPGERSKSWVGTQRILREALSAGLGRDGLIVGIGGGMICDLAAFSASLFMRGCRLFLVPTSLLAMVDAAVGGKTAINFRGYKNMVGTFYPAEQIWIAVSALRYLPEREFRSGLGEVIKTALLGDPVLFEILLNRRELVLARDSAIMEELVRRCVEVKARIVEEDLRESGERAFLNLGHTFAHALEMETKYRLWSHGQAVAWGLVQAAMLSETLGLADPSYTAAVQSLIRSYGFDLQPGRKPESVVAAMQVDKKKRRGKLRLVLQRGIGDTVVREVDPLLIVEMLSRSARIFP